MPNLAWYEQTVGGKHADTKPLKGFGGAGVLEVTADHESGTFRAVYTVKFANALYVLHAFQKKSKTGVKTPKAVLELVRKRLKAAEEHYEAWRAHQEDEEGD